MENKKNFQTEGEKIIKKLKGKPKLLLHSCCGPCSSAVLEYLTKYFTVTVYFYNPNILPKEEYEKRLEAQKKILDSMEFPDGKPELIIPEYDSSEFEKRTQGMMDLPEGGDRCTECFKLRIGNTAHYAKQNGYEWYCTTLSVSPHKDEVRINWIGEQYADIYDVKWLPSDFKKKDGYKRSTELSEQYELYRQDYCGCTPRKD